VPPTDIPLGLGFDDVLLVPQRTSVASRADTDLSTPLAAGITLRIPILSANTPWCTGARMAVAMATAGGVGVLHRMQTVDQQCRDLAEVKKATPAGDLATVDAAGRLRAGAAIGVVDDWKERAEALVEGGVDFLVTDVAHGHADYVLSVVSQLKARFPDVPVVAGNVATAAATRDLVDAGADVVKVGIGPGGICTTRIVAGSGVPQLTAVMDCAAEATRNGVPVIADGGIKEPGDVVKALAAGAGSVMVGSVLAGADESEARPFEREDGSRVKISTGFVTFGMRLTLKRARGETVTREELAEYTPEGVESTFAATGTVSQTLQPFLGGLRSGMSYSGAHTLAQLRERARFVRITPAGLAESRPHALNRTEQLPLDYAQDTAG
jgi:IMP dehydrogenase/GMP reductase